MRMDYENQVAGSPRDNLHRGIAQFLKLYFDGRTERPPDESNGNNPVSRYKVAADSWRQLDEIFRRTGDTRYEATRDLVATLMPTGKPAHTRDLAAQTIGLCLIEPTSAMRQGIVALLSRQQPFGGWFDLNPYEQFRTPFRETQWALIALSLTRTGFRRWPAKRAGNAPRRHST